MRIELTSVSVDDQAEALAFSTEVLGFEVRRDVPLGDDRWLTVVSPQAPVFDDTGGNLIQIIAERPRRDEVLPRAGGVGG